MRDNMYELRDTPILEGWFACQWVVAFLSLILAAIGLCLSNRRLVCGLTIALTLIWFYWLAGPWLYK
jgi:hypothetical protein